MCKFRDEPLPVVHHLMMFDVDDFLSDDDDDEEDNDDNFGGDDDDDDESLSDGRNWEWYSGEDQYVPSANTTVDERPDNSWTTTITTATTVSTTSFSTETEISSILSLGEYVLDSSNALDTDATTKSTDVADSDRTEYLGLFDFDSDLLTCPVIENDDDTVNCLSAEDSSIPFSSDSCRSSATGHETYNDTNISSSRNSIASTTATSDKDMSHKTSTEGGDIEWLLDEDSDLLQVYGIDSESNAFFSCTDCSELHASVENDFGDDLQMETTGNTTISLDISYAEWLGQQQQHQLEILANQDSTIDSFVPSETEGALAQANATPQTASLAFADYDAELFTKMMNADSIGGAVAVAVSDSDLMELPSASIDLTQLSGDTRWDDQSYVIMYDDDTADDGSDGIAYDDAEMVDIYGP